MDDMSKKEISKDVEIIVRYETKADKNKSKTLQNIMRELFDLYIAQATQNIDKVK